MLLLGRGGTKFTTLKRGNILPRYCSSAAGAKVSNVLLNSKNKNKIEAGDRGHPLSEGFFHGSIAFFLRSSIARRVLRRDSIFGLTVVRVY